MDVVAYGYGPALGMPDLSPFCCKLHAYLTLAEVDARWEVGVAPKAPRGKLPWAEIDGVAVSDSSVIVSNIEATVGLDDGLTPREVALARVMKSAAEEHLYFLLLYWRWAYEPGWSSYRSAIADVVRLGGVPGFMSSSVATVARRGVLKSLNAQGIGRMTEEELSAAGEDLVGSVAELVGDGPWALGPRPTTLDATLYGMLGGAWLPDMDNPLKSALSEHPRLTAYIERLHTRVTSPGE